MMHDFILMIQAYLSYIVGLVSDYSIKQILQLSKSDRLVGFPVHRKVMFIVYYSLLSEHQYCVFKKKRIYLNLKILCC